MGMQTLNIALNTGGVISLLVGTVLPLIVGYVTKASMNKGLKSSILAALSGASAVLSQWAVSLEHQLPFAWQASVVSALITFAVAEGTYLKIWKASGISDLVQAKGVVDPETPASTSSTVSSSTGDATPPKEAAVWRGPEHAAR